MPWTVKARHRDFGGIRFFEEDTEQAAIDAAKADNCEIISIEPPEGAPAAEASDDGGVAAYYKNQLDEITTPFTGYRIRGDAPLTISSIAIAVQHAVFWAIVKVWFALLGLNLLCVFVLWVLWKSGALG